MVLNTMPKKIKLLGVLLLFLVCISGFEWGYGEIESSLYSLFFNSMILITGILSAFFIFIRRSFFKINLLDVVVIAYLAYCIIISILRLHGSLMVYQKDIYSYISFLIIYLIVRSINSDELFQKYSVLILIFFGILNCFFAWFQFFKFRDSVLVTGLLENSGLLGGYLCALTPLLFTLLVKNQVSRIMQSLLVAVFFVSTIFITESRTAIISTFVIFILFIYSYFNIKKRFLFGSVSLLIVFLLFLFLYNQRTSSFDGRILIWKVAATMLPEKQILFGRGLGYVEQKFNYFQGLYFSNSKVGSKEQLLAGDTRTVFNEPLRMLIEIGVVGSLLFLVLLWCFFTRDQKPSRSDNIAINLSIMSILIFGLCSYPFQSYSISVLFYVLLAISCKQTVVKTTKTLVSIGLLIPVSVIFFMILTAMQTIYSVNKWVNAKKSNWKYNEAKIYRIYKAQEERLISNSNFLADFGRLLNSIGYYNQATSILSKAVELRYSVHNLVSVGYNAEVLGTYALAEEEYRKATFITPKSLFPRVYLFNLYVRSRQKENAEKYAIIILNTPIKIPSAKTDSIRYYIANYLLKN